MRRRSVHSSSRSPVITSSEVSANTQSPGFRGKSQEIPVVELELPSLVDGQRLFMQNRILTAKVDGSSKEKSYAVILFDGAFGSGINSILDILRRDQEHSQVYDDVERKTWRGLVLSDVVMTMVRLFQEIEYDREVVPSRLNMRKVRAAIQHSGEMKQAVQNVLEARVYADEYSITPDVAESLRQLWRKDTVRVLFRENNTDD